MASTAGCRCCCAGSTRRARHRLPAGAEGAERSFRKAPIRDAGYGAIWHGQKSWNGVAILARGKPVRSRPGAACPAIPTTLHSRYIEAAVNGLLIGCLYLPNGNPAPGPKFDYKLRWFERLIAHAAELLASGAPVVLAGDYNVMPTDLDVYKPERWVDDALFRPEVREAYRRLSRRAGPMRCGRFIRTSASTRSGTISGTPTPATPGCASTTCCSARPSPRVCKAAGVDREVRGWEKASDHAPVWIELADKPLNGEAKRRGATINVRAPRARAARQAARRRCRRARR